MLDLRGSDLVQRFRGDRAAYEAHVHAVAPGLEELDGRRVGLQQHQDQDQRQQPPAAEEGAAQRELVALRHVCELYERQAGADGQSLLARWREECLKLMVASETEAESAAQRVAVAEASAEAANERMELLASRLDAEAARAERVERSLRGAEAGAAAARSEAETARASASTTRQAVSRVRHAVEGAVAGVRERATELEGAIAVRLAGFEARLRFAAGRLSVAEAMRQQVEPSDTPQNVPVPPPQHQLLTQASLRRLPAAELAAEVERLSHERASLAARLARAMVPPPAPAPPSAAEAAEAAMAKAAAAEARRAAEAAETRAAEAEERVAAAEARATEADAGASAAEARASTAEAAASAAEAAAAESREMLRSRIAESEGAGCELAAAAEAARAEAAKSASALAEAHVRLAQSEKRYERDVSSTDLRCTAAERERDSAMASVDDLETQLAACRRELGAAQREASRAAIAQRHAERMLARTKEAQSDAEIRRSRQLEERLAAREQQLRELRRERSALLQAVRSAERPKAIRRDEEGATGGNGVDVPASGEPPVATVTAGVAVPTPADRHAMLEALDSLADLGEELLADGDALGEP